MEKLTNSRRKCWAECPRKHHYTYNLGFRPVRTAEALAFGSGFHLALETWAKSPVGGVPDVRMLRDAKGRPIQLDTEFDLMRLQALVLGWITRWKDEPVEYVAVEEEFEFALVHPITGETSSYWILGGKMDGIIRRLVRESTLEYKTSTEDTSVGSVYWQRLPMNSQISLYHDGARSRGYSPESCTYDVSLKPGQRPLKQNKKNKRDETPEEYFGRICDDIAKNPASYFARSEIPRSERELDRARLDIWEVAEQMRIARESGCSPRNPEACFNYGKPCTFLSVCLGETTLENANWLTKVDNIHPELG